jgi:hypothetical protein
MNNNRLSTNSNSLVIDANTRSELDVLMKSEPLISVDSEGRAMIISNKKYTNRLAIYLGSALS